MTSLWPNLVSRRQKVGKALSFVGRCGRSCRSQPDPGRWRLTAPLSFPRRLSRKMMSSATAREIPPLDFDAQPTFLLPVYQHLIFPSKSFIQYACTRTTVPMPNISFDIFFNDDLVNITASRSQGAPKVKPGWKARSAPKIAQKQKPTPDSAFGPKAASLVSNALQNAPQYAENLQALGTAFQQQQQANSATSAPKAAAPPQTNAATQAAKKTAASPAPKLGNATSKAPAAKAATSGISQDRGRSVTAKARGEAAPKLNGAPKVSAATKKVT